jgi:hypothetical protein
MTTSVDVVRGDEVVCLGDALRAQAANCLALGSPLSHDLLLALVRPSAPGGPLYSLLANHQTSRGGDLVGLRLLAAAHRLVLARRAPALAAYFPTAGGVAPRTSEARAVFGEALVDALVGNPEVLLSALARIPQTNETGRALPLRGALGRVSSAHGLPVRLHELAASAGLNLRVDVMPWAQAPIGGPMRIVERAGCDLRPLDPTHAEDRLTLASYIWGDDLTRFERLRTAFTLAQRVPAELRAMSAGSYLSSLLQQDPVPGQTLVIWHSATWFYLERTSRAEIRALIRKLAARASAVSPLVHVSWEWQREAGDPMRSFALVGRSWPAAGAWAPWRPGTPVQLGSGPAHGMPMRWAEPKPLSSDPLET